MVAIRPETEIDRTQAALAATGLALPLRRGDVELAVAPEAAASPVGQRLLVVLVNEFARMKGVVRRVHLGTRTPDLLGAMGALVRRKRLHG